MLVFCPSDLASGAPPILLDILFAMAPFLHQILTAVMLAGAAIGSPVSPHIGVPVNDLTGATGRFSVKQGT